MAAIEPAGMPAVRLRPLGVRWRRVTRSTTGRWSGSSARTCSTRGRPTLRSRPCYTPSCRTSMSTTPTRTPCSRSPTSRTARPGAPISTASGRWLVPYIMPGFGLARACARAYATNPACEGLILLKHGVFSFGDTAEEAYGTHDRAGQPGRGRAAPPGHARVRARAVAAPAGPAGPRWRRSCAVLRASRWTEGGGRYRRAILRFRTGPRILDYVNGAELARYSQRGVVTPDHVIPHQGEAAHPATAAPRRVGRIRRGRTRGLRAIPGRLQGLFSAPGCAPGGAEEAARSRPARDPGAGAGPVHDRPHRGGRGPGRGTWPRPRSR